MTIDVRPAAGREELDAALALRRAVFVGEQGVSVAEEVDGRDGKALHLVAIADGELVGTCRLLVDGERVKLGRMAVAAAARRRGVGLALLRAADAHARRLGGRRIVLGAQTQARSLYERAGYRAFGETFLDAGLEHVRMEKPLA